MTQRKAWQRSEPHEHAVLFQMDGTKVGLYQTVGGPDGRYAYQEDALISFAIPEFKQVNDIVNTIKATVEDLQNSWGQERMTGSTVCGTIAWMEANEIKTCNPLIGDGMQVLVVLTSQGELKASYLLNPNLQTPTNAEEKIRLSKIGFVRNDRLAGMLAISGAIGDRDFETAGLTHTPNITLENFALAPGDKAFIVVATDGLIEAHFNEKKIGEFISKNWNKSLEAMAKQLAEEAIKTSTDNVSIGIFQIGNIPTAVFAFDGHGGPKVSNNLATHFYDALKEKMK